MKMRRTAPVPALAALAVLAALLAAPAAAQPAFQWDEVRRDRDILSRNLPAPVRATANRELRSISEAEVLTMRDGRTLYKLEGNDKAGVEQKLVVAPDGRLILREAD